MPNDVYQCLSIVSGDSATRQQFWQYCRGSQSFVDRQSMWNGQVFGRYLTEDLDFESILSLYENDEMVHDRNDRWGTKWNAYRYEYQPTRAEHKDPDSLCFGTAYLFVLPIFRELARVFPTLRLRLEFVEEFGDFVGAVDAEKGELCRPSHIAATSRDIVKSSGHCDPSDEEAINSLVFLNFYSQEAAGIRRRVHFGNMHHEVDEALIQQSGDELVANCASAGCANPIRVRDAAGNGSICQCNKGCDTLYCSSSCLEMDLHIHPRTCLQLRARSWLGILAPAAFPLIDLYLRCKRY